MLHYLDMVDAKMFDMEDALRNVEPGGFSDSELEIMQLLWHSPKALPLSEIRKSLQQSMNWEATTIKTLLQRLVSKRAVLQEKREVFYYSPLVSEAKAKAELQESEVSSTLEVVEKKVEELYFSILLLTDRKKQWVQMSMKH